MAVYSIAKNPYQDHRNVQEKLSLNEWKALVESKPEMVWFEDTSPGRASIKLQPNIKLKRYARSEWDSKKGYYHLQLNYLDEYGYISVVIDLVMIPRRMWYLLEVARELGALFLKDGKKIIDEKYIEDYENKRANKKGNRAKKDDPE